EIERLHETPLGVFNGDVDAIGRVGDEPRDQVGNERLELQALLERRAKRLVVCGHSGHHNPGNRGIPPGDGLASCGGGFYSPDAVLQPKEDSCSRDSSSSSCAGTSSTSRWAWSSEARSARWWRRSPRTC